MRKARFWASRRLETRIGTAIICAIAAILALALVQFLIARRAHFVVFQRAWLEKSVQEAVALALRTPAAERTGKLGQMPASQWLTMSWSTAPPRDQRPLRPPPPQLDQRLDHTLQTLLAGQARQVSVQFLRHRPHEPGSHGRHAGLPRRDPAHDAAHDRAHDTGGDVRPDAATASVVRVVEQRPEAPAFPPAGGAYGVTILPPLSGSDSGLTHDSVVPAIFDIKLELEDHSWLRIVPRHAHEADWLMELPLPLIGGAFAVVVLSIFTARRILAPLNALTIAAKRLGVERDHGPIPIEGLNEFSAIAQALNEMHGRLSRFVDERTQMLAAISHDMRTSLTRLSLTIEELDDARLKGALSREISEMNGMIGATLAFASNDARVEPSSEVDLAALLISLCDEASDEGHRVRYVGPDHLPLRCQRLMMKRAITNVLENALKYGVAAHVALQRTDREIIVEIADEGPGIPPEQRAQAFAPFQRLEQSRNRETGGVGLGLTIARDVVHAHGGEIHLDAAPAGGLLVRIALPAC